MVYDDWFETVHSSETEPPDQWNKMLAFQWFRSSIDDEDVLPDLDSEWLTPEEQQNMLQRQRLEREKTEMVFDEKEAKPLTSQASVLPSPSDNLSSSTLPQFT